MISLNQPLSAGRSLGPTTHRKRQAAGRLVRGLRFFRNERTHASSPDGAKGCLTLAPRDERQRAAALRERLTLRSAATGEAKNLHPETCVGRVVGTSQVSTARQREKTWRVFRPLVGIRRRRGDEVFGPSIPVASPRSPSCRQWRVMLRSRAQIHESPPRCGGLSRNSASPWRPAGGEQVLEARELVEQHAVSGPGRVVVFVGHDGSNAGPIVAAAPARGKTHAMPPGRAPFIELEGYGPVR